MQQLSWKEQSHNRHQSSISESICSQITNTSNNLINDSMNNSNDMHNNSYFKGKNSIIQKDQFDIEEDQIDINSPRRDNQQKQQQLQQLKDKLVTKQQHIIRMAAIILQQRNNIKQFQFQLKNKDYFISQLKMSLKQQQDQLNSYKAIISQQKQKIQLYQKNIQSQSILKQQYDAQILKFKKQIQNLNNIIANKNNKSDKNRFMPNNSIDDSQSVYYSIFDKNSKQYGSFQQSEVEFLYNLSSKSRVKISQEKAIQKICITNHKQKHQNLISTIKNYQITSQKGEQKKVKGDESFLGLPNDNQTKVKRNSDLTNLKFKFFKQPSEKSLKSNKNKSFNLSKMSKNSEKQQPYSQKEILQLNQIVILKQQKINELELETKKLKQQVVNLSNLSSELQGYNQIQRDQFNRRLYYQRKKCKQKVQEIIQLKLINSQLLDQINNLKCKIALVKQLFKAKYEQIIESKLSMIQNRTLQIAQGVGELINLYKGLIIDCGIQNNQFKQQLGQLLQNIIKKLCGKNQFQYSENQRVINQFQGEATNYEILKKTFQKYWQQNLNEIVQSKIRVVIYRSLQTNIVQQTQNQCQVDLRKQEKDVFIQTYTLIKQKDCQTQFIYFQKQSQSQTIVAQYESKFIQADYIQSQNHSQTEIKEYKQYTFQTDQKFKQNETQTISKDLVSYTTQTNQCYLINCLKHFQMQTQNIIVDVSQTQTLIPILKQIQLQTDKKSKQNETQTISKDLVSYTTQTNQCYLINCLKHFQMQTQNIIVDVSQTQTLIPILKQIQLQTDKKSKQNETQTISKDLVSYTTQTNQCYLINSLKNFQMQTQNVIFSTNQSQTNLKRQSKVQTFCPLLKQASLQTNWEIKQLFTQTQIKSKNDQYIQTDFIQKDKVVQTNNGNQIKKSHFISINLEKQQQVQNTAPFTIQNDNQNNQFLVRVRRKSTQTQLHLQLFQFGIEIQPKQQSKALQNDIFCKNQSKLKDNIINSINQFSLKKVSYLRMQNGNPESQIKNGIQFQCQNDHTQQHKVFSSQKLKFHTPLNQQSLNSNKKHQIDYKKIQFNDIKSLTSQNLIQKLVPKKPNSISLYYVQENIGIRFKWDPDLIYIINAKDDTKQKSEIQKFIFWSKGLISLKNKTQLRLKSKGVSYEDYGRFTIGNSQILAWNNQLLVRVKNKYSSLIGDMENGSWKVIGCQAYK